MAQEAAKAESYGEGVVWVVKVGGKNIFLNWYIGNITVNPRFEGVNIVMVR